MMRAAHSLPFLIAVLLVQTGCSGSVLQLRDQLNLQRGEFRQELTGKHELLAKFLACTGQAHDERLIGRPAPGPVPEPLALESRGESTSVRPVAAVIQRIHQTYQDKGGSLSILANVVNDLGDGPRARIDLDKLKQIVDMAGQWHGHLGLNEDQLEQDSSRFVRILLAYNTAYFGDFSFTAMPDSAGTGLRGVLSVTSKGFVDRSGNTLLFPGISAVISASPGGSVRLSATPIDSQRVSADLTRIFLEAFFDAAYRVPAVHGATALRVGWKPGEPVYPEFDADHPSISLDALGKLTRDSLRAEAAVTSVVGKAVRGGSVFGTQNETLAASLETAAGIMAKKLVEHEGFCYFQVTQ